MMANTGSGGIRAAPRYSQITIRSISSMVTVSAVRS